MHQFIATLGVMIGTVFLAFQAVPSVPFVRVRINRGLHWILTETPYFPLQLSCAVILGYLIFRSRFQHSALLWVWVLPLLWIGLAFFWWVPDVTGITETSRMAHLFGWGCQPKFHCFDQLAFTLPFYSSLAYSSGALLAKLTSKKDLHDNVSERQVNIVK